MDRHDDEVEVKLGSEAGARSTGGVAVAEAAHAEVRGYLSDYLEMSLPDDLRDLVDHHLGQCPSCRAFLDGLVRTIELLRQLPQSPAPPAAKERVLRIAQDFVARD